MRQGRKKKKLPIATIDCIGIENKSKVGKITFSLPKSFPASKSRDKLGYV